MKKILIKIPVLFLLFCLLSLTERTLGIYGLCVAFCFALLHAREKPYFFLPAYVGGAILVDHSLSTLVLVAAVNVSIVVLSFIHYKTKWKYSILEVILLAVACLAGKIAFGPFTALGIATIVVSVIVTVFFAYLSVVALYPILVRGIKNQRNGNENVCLSIFTVFLSVGIAAFRPFSVNAACFLFALILCPLCAMDRAVALPFGLCVGAGAAIGLYDPSAALYFAAPALVVYALGKKKSPIRALGSVCAFFFTTGFFLGKVDLYSLVPFFAGTLLTAFIPDKFLKKISFQESDARYALRTVVNRDRECLSEKLSGIATAFIEMHDVLLSEQPKKMSPEYVVRAVCEKCCLVCPHFRSCMREMGDLAVPVRKLVHTSVSTGKVSILDADASLGKHCLRLPDLLRTVNEETDYFHAEKKRLVGVEQSKQTVLAELSGISDVLNRLSKSVNVNLSFETGAEQKVKERLNRASVVCRDACIYLDGEEKEVTLVVRDKDADRPVVAEVLTEILGTPMVEFFRKKEINGEVSLHFCRAPRYKILYGESFSAEENRCGDTRKAVKIDNHRSLFLLSDGMGTGKKALDTATRVSDLLVSFYRAGFSHETVFANVSHLLSLRVKEDFSALDAVIIDTDTAECDFIKQGGRESFLFTPDGYEVISGDSLPLGIVETAPNTVRKKLRPDDLIVLMSDGVADALTPSEVAEIVESAAKNPKSVTEKLLQNALRLAKKPDDMTVVAMRIVRA